jgi:hypothetical protein
MTKLSRLLTRTSGQKKKHPLNRCKILPIYWCATALEPTDILMQKKIPPLWSLGKIYLGEPTISILDLLCTSLSRKGSLELSKKTKSISSRMIRYARQHHSGLHHYSLLGPTKQRCTQVQIKYFLYLDTDCD